ncbi:hypothetical protein D3C81_1316560 [compost metagenome]
MTCGPFTHSSPISPSGCSTPASLMILHRVDGTGMPMVPIWMFWIGLTVATGLVSVMP